MGPDAFLRNEAGLSDDMLRTMGFMLGTYVPLQVAAIVMTKRLLWRLAAALPLVPMVPVINLGCSPDAYGDGSLYGLVFYFPYAPVMVYLAIFCIVGSVSVFARAKGKSPKASTESHPNVDGKSGVKSIVLTLIYLVLLALFLLLCLVLIPFR